VAKRRIRVQQKGEKRNNNVEISSESAANYFWNTSLKAIERIKLWHGLFLF
jgi:hypothetical protein